MRNIFPGHFRPTQAEFNILWDNAIFVVDANVVLNLYRYSTTTRNELQKILDSLKSKIFIPHQAAEEFLRNRLTVTAEQSDEYTTTIKEIEKLVKKITSKDRHPFIDDDATRKLEEFSEQITNNLKEQQQALMRKLTNDEILEFVRVIFDGHTGLPYPQDEIEQIIKEGESRYQNKIPPGYKDNNKESPNAPHRKYGDLIVWYQTIDYSKNSQKPVIFITDDKKEDWWLEQSGKTIGPRPELIEEFKKKAEQEFWMYSVSRFVQEYSSRNDNQVATEILTEIRNVSAELDRQKNIQNSITFYTKKINQPSILTSQYPDVQESIKNEGVIVVTLQRNMKYATGSGKFTPELFDIPDFDVSLIDMPSDVDEDDIKISFGCGTTKDFNVHLKAKSGELPSGDYVFHYVAKCDEDEIFDATDLFETITDNE